MYAEVIRRALDEDLAQAGDLTSDACIPADAEATGHVVVRAPGVLAGLEVAGTVFARVDGRITFEGRSLDGEEVEAMTTVAVVTGPARSILTGERTALNLLGRMSGVATATAELVRLVEGTGAAIMDTRKTMPGLRALDKYAVRTGGGRNHRFGLYDAVMIKDNHIAVAGSLTEAVLAARTRVGHTVKIEVEVESLDQLDELLAVGADLVLLDNMDLATLSKAVRRVDGQMVCEASGGVTRHNVRAIAETGVDVISVGWITHSAPQLDVTLDLA